MNYTPLTKEEINKSFTGVPVIFDGGVFLQFLNDDVFLSFTPFPKNEITASDLRSITGCSGVEAIKTKALISNGDLFHFDFTIEATDGDGKIIGTKTLKNCFSKCVGSFISESEYELAAKEVVEDAKASLTKV